MSYRKLLAPGLFAAAIVAAFALLFPGVFTSQAVQNPSISLDMVTSGTTYTETQDGNGDFLPDPGTNVMNVGTVNNCLVTAAPGNNLQHSHTVHIVVHNVEDLVGWDFRLNYFGDKMRPNTLGGTAFADSFYGQNVSFMNLPVDKTAFVHRDVLTATSIPPAAPGPQTALMGAVYIGSQNFAISPDTPAKAVPDDDTYDAPTGGVIATLNVSVLAGNAGQALSLDADDANPNAPGSQVHIFTSTGLQTIQLAESALGDGFHDEGSGSCVPGPTPTAPPTTATLTPTVTPTATPMPTTPTPTPTVTATPIPPTPTATITTSIPVPREVTLQNDTGQAASDLHITFDRLFCCMGDAVELIQNAPGCPTPSEVAQSPNWDADWGTACVDPTESVTVRVWGQPGTPAPNVDCFFWTIFGEPLPSPDPCGPTPTPTPGTPTVTATPCAPEGCPTPTPTATATPPPVAGHDARLTRISGVPKNVRLSPGEVITDSASVVVANESNHTEMIGVYVDVMAPSGCTPSGRVLETTVSAAAGGKTTIPIPVSYSCSDVSAANGQSYAWTAVADHGADDLASCGAGSLQGLTCFNALADDDEDTADNRRSRTGPKVIAQ